MLLITIKHKNKLNTINKISAVIGPCIGKESYEVGLDFYKNFLLLTKKNSIYLGIYISNHFKILSETSINNLGSLGP